MKSTGHQLKSPIMTHASLASSAPCILIAGREQNHERLFLDLRIGSDLADEDLALAESERRSRRTAHERKNSP